MIYGGSSNSCGAVIICKEDNNCSLFLFIRCRQDIHLMKPLLDEDDFDYRRIGNGGQKAIGTAHRERIQSDWLIVNGM
jgi:hypothetical protein